MEQNEDEFLIEGATYNRLLTEFRKFGSLCIGYDFDGTVNDYHKRGSTYEQVITLLRDLKALGCRLVCWTAYHDLAHVERYLDQNKIPYDGINTIGIPLGWESKKPFFSALLDDRAGLAQVYGELREIANIIKQERNGSS